MRYADDFVILCRTPRAGERILTSITRFMRDKLKLIVNETKSGVVPLCEASFLGFQIVHRKVRWSEKSHKKFKAEVRSITGRTRGVSPTKVMSDLKTYLRGALNYYVIGIPFGDIRELDGWLRRRMRLSDWTAFAAIAAFYEIRSQTADRSAGRINNGDGLARDGGGCSRWGSDAMK